MTIANLEKRLGSGVKRAAKTWFSPHMAAASRAVSERIPLVDLVLEVRDARIPLSSEYDQLRNFPSSSKRIIVLNKMDLANRLEIKCLKFLQAQVKGVKKIDHSSYTATIMLVGIPNVGKSALANSLHQIGRISAAEKGKLKHATVSPIPGETRDISSLKIGSHPNVYVLDTPGILPPDILDVVVCSKLALTGAIKDCLVGEKELAQYFLSILNRSDEYKKWEKLSAEENEISTIDQRVGCLGSSELDSRQKRQYPTDHTQDFVVREVRRVLFETISSFPGSLEKEKDLSRLIETQFTALREAFRVASESGEDVENKVAAKLLNLYRTGRLGHYTLDSVPRNIQ
ncbi:DAR GTPase 2, mitochondrial isoform X2 [Vitis vinifera]|uniref:DAR GTPase 2, mitochondrial isoform X2 n=1 Tax=Vitis vinifera TaxID=29760 RepID=UPI00053FCBF5|nr:DAR GTPase 2, mitochondrial isoform X2 [Vitis vinifera]|eukprot:XP_010662217.1 PREDICTED: DAR GTPase 2, mitochondrial isoform X2 [Vitis vinifera]